MKRSLADMRCFLLDMDGTFYLGERLLEGALDFLHTLEEHGKEYLFLTNNSSRDRRIYAQKFERLGVAIPEEKIFTAGEATALYLRRERPGARVYVVGTPSLEQEFRLHGFELTSEDPQAVVLGFDTTLTYEKLWKLCDFARAGLPYIATHPDLNCPTDGGFMPDIGAMIAFVKTATGRQPDVVVGKPNRIIIDELSRKIHVPLEQLAMIGDRLYTDIALNTTAGITTILVLSGETRASDLDGSPFQPDYTFRHLGEVAEQLKQLQKREQAA
jgi:4-nitrophenyl phosphatase